MNYKYTDIEKFIQFTSWTDKQKIDELLRIDCSLYAHLGIDSTKAEKEEVKKKSINIYRTIKTIDSKLGDEFLYTMDLKR
jgi:hypothetical protein|tara:strand:+ start:42 stop:281 length:240 start_codon:yes stop_codon:yes gene_type:complete